MHVHYWPGEYVAISGLMVKVKSAKLVKTGETVPFEQDQFRVRFNGLPIEAPDWPLTTLEIECDAEPHQDTDFVRKNKPRGTV
jgi:alpha-L-fucosidase